MGTGTSEVETTSEATLKNFFEKRRNSLQEIFLRNSWVVRGQCEVKGVFLKVGVYSNIFVC
jgi:hypothetical protein